MFEMKRDVIIEETNDEVRTQHLGSMKHGQLQSHSKLKGDIQQKSKNTNTVEMKSKKEKNAASKQSCDIPKKSENEMVQMMSKLLRQ